MPDNDPTIPAPKPSAELHGLDPGELLARGLQSEKPPSIGPWEPPTPEELNRMLPQYQIECLLGRGGMGAVYKGIQPSLGRPVAIKLLPAEVAANEQFVARFEREARTLAKLQHSRIITIHDFGRTSEGHLYFVMEYIDGTDLRTILNGPGLEPEQALLVIGQICDALHAAHKQGIVHRDIKPANILITRDGYVKLADFGLACPEEQDDGGLTSSNVVMGTAAYMAPEQRAGHTDHRSDIYALGVMLYEMLTGKRPQGVFDPPSVRVQVDVRLDEVVIKALQQEPERRYQQVSEMKTDVERIRTTPPGTKLPPNGQPPAVSKPASASSLASRKSLSLAAAIVVTLLAIGGFFLWKKAHQPAFGSAAPITATKDQPWENSLGMKFVPVPIKGGPTDGQEVFFSIWDTRVQDYEAFANATYHTPVKPPFEQGPTHPVVNVNWNEAVAFCAWLTEREQASGKLPANYRYRLPSDHEWSCAVGIGDREDATKTPEEKDRKIGNVFPWGDQWPPPPGAGNYAGEEFKTGAGLSGYQDGFVNTSPVGSFVANPFGLYDMGGNVWQWCEDWVNKEQKDRAVRGAAWSHNARDRLLSSHHYNKPPLYRGEHDIGFRCALVSTPIQPTQKPATLLPATPPPVAPASAIKGQSWDRAINLLPLIDLDRDVVSGSCRLINGELRVTGQFDPFPNDDRRFKTARVQFPYQPPAEYDLRISFTPLEGLKFFHHVLRAAGRTFTWKLQGADGTFVELDGNQVPNPSTGKVNPPLENGHRYTSLIEVRKDGVTAYVDGRQVSQLHTDYHDLKKDSWSALNDDSLIGIGCWFTDAIFHSIEVREVTGHGTLLRTAPATTPTGSAKVTATKDQPFFASCPK